jgi:hypothetical protein
MWIIMALQSISPKVTVKDCKRCCMSIAMDETDDDVLGNDSEEGGNFSSECEEDEGTEFEDGDSDAD